MSLKKELLDNCKKFAANKLKTVEDAIADLKLSAYNETKSSVGDKYETGRAMIQNEIEKNAAQLKVWQNQLLELERLNPEYSPSKAEFGAIVYCSTANYFIAEACGKYIIEDKMYITVSKNSPVYLAMAGCLKGENFDFNTQKIKILEII
jgi:propanediol dehydratase small subunit